MMAWAEKSKEMSFMYFWLDVTIVEVVEKFYRESLAGVLWSVKIKNP